MNTHWLLLVHTFHSAWQSGYLDLKTGLLNSFFFLHFSHSHAIIIGEHLSVTVFSKVTNMSWSKFMHCFLSVMIKTLQWPHSSLLYLSEMFIGMHSGVVCGVVCLIVITSTSWNTAFRNGGLLLSLSFLLVCIILKSFHRQTRLLCSCAVFKTATQCSALIGYLVCLYI